MIIKEIIGTIEIGIPRVRTTYLKKTLLNNLLYEIHSTFCRNVTTFLHFRIIEDFYVFPHNIYPLSDFGGTKEKPLPENKIYEVYRIFESHFYVVVRKSDNETDLYNTCLYNVTLRNGEYPVQLSINGIMVRHGTESNKVKYVGQI